MRGVRLTLLSIGCLAVYGRTLYDILEVSSTASTSAIKQSYRNLAKKLHPDKNKDDPSSHDKFIEVSKAYEILSDEENRRKYDANLRYGFDDPEDVGGPSRQSDGAMRSQQEQFVVFQTPRGPVYVRFKGGDPFGGGPVGAFDPFSFGEDFIRAQQQGSFHNPFGYMPPPEPLWYEILQILIQNGVLATILLAITYLYYNRGSFLDFLSGRGGAEASGSGTNGSAADRKFPPMKTSYTVGGRVDITEDGKLKPFEGDFSEERTIVVIALTDKAESEVLSLREKYLKDRLRFRRLPGSGTLPNSEDDTTEDRMHLLAIGKGGERWTSLSWNKDTVLTKVGSLSDGYVDAWLLKLLIGELKWRSVAEEPIPIKLPTNSTKSE